MSRTFVRRPTLLPFSRPTIGEAEIQGVVETLKSGWITTGPKTVEFEKKFAEYTGARHALACSSGTGAHHLLMLALGIGPGDEVITTPLTWASTVNILVACGATPVLADIDPRTVNLDPEAAAAKITSKTKAIIPVHFAGLPCDLDRFFSLADRHGLTIIEDAAHAVGSYYKGRHVGSFAHPAYFSFHPIKNITTVEGGMITTNDDDLAAKLKLYRFHGVNRDSWARAGRGGGSGYDIMLPGFKYNLTDIQSVLGLAQLAQLDQFNAQRTRLVQCYFERLGDVDEIQLPVADPGYEIVHPWHLFTVQIQNEKLDIDRFGFMEALRELNIGSGLHFLAVHLASFYQERFGFRPGDFPHAEQVSDRILSLPLFPQMTEDDVDDVVAAIKQVIQSHRRTA